MSLAAPTDFRPTRAGSRAVRARALDPFEQAAAAAARLAGAAAGELARARRSARSAFRLVMFALSLALAVAFLSASARAGEKHTFIIPPDDGYGLEDCLATKSACGAMVASAWCQANGLKGVERFGRAEELDGEPGRPAGAQPGSFYVACSESI